MLLYILKRIANLMQMSCLLNSWINQTTKWIFRREIGMGYIQTYGSRRSVTSWEHPNRSIEGYACTFGAINATMLRALHMILGSVINFQLQEWERKKNIRWFIILIRVREPYCLSFLLFSWWIPAEIKGIDLILGSTRRPVLSATELPIRDLS